MTTKSHPEPTAEALTDLRDTQHLSWAKVADELGLGNPGSARRLYSALVRPHTESVLPTQLCGGYGPAPLPIDLTKATQAEVEKAIAGKFIVVQRRNGTEDIHVARVTSLKAGTVNFNDGSKSRSVKLEAIIAAQ